MKRTAHLSQTIGVALEGDGVEIGPDGLPTAVRLFRAGRNETAKGVFIFDEQASVSTLAAAKQWAVDLMIDLEHQSLDRDAPNWDPNARGWLCLEKRGGELWAVNLRWTPDGVRRLTEKTQRYISPAFRHDADGRVLEIVNIALCAMPATYGTPALVAASRTNHRSPRMTLKERLALLAALTVRISAGKSAIVKLAEGEPEAEPAAGKFEAVQAASKLVAEAMAALEGVDGVDESMAAVDAAKAAVAEFEKAVAAMTGGAAEPAAEPAPEAASENAEPAKEEEEKAVAAAASRLMRLSGKRSLVDALDAAETWRASHLELETERAKLAKERETLESAERREGCAALVKLGGLAPAAVWADEKATAPAAYLAAMPINDFRKFVTASTAGRKAPAVRPPTTTDGVATLSAREIAMCAEMKIDPKTYAANKSLKKG